MAILSTASRIPKESFMAASPKPPSTIGKVRDVFPKLGELTDTVVFGDVWERKQLPKRERRLISVAARVAMCSSDQLRGQLRPGLDEGVRCEVVMVGLY